METNVLVLIAVLVAVVAFTVALGGRNDVSASVTAPGLHVSLKARDKKAKKKRRRQRSPQSNGPDDAPGRHEDITAVVGRGTPSEK